MHRAVKISEFIEKLAAAIAQHGDIFVFLDAGNGMIYPSECVIVGHTTKSGDSIAVVGNVRE